ncbi:MAG: substrate-binding domain-containing protein [Planctomycetaceae bacterium]
MKRFVLTLILLALVGCNSADNSTSESTSSGDKSYRIAVIPKGTTHEFWKSVHYGAEQAAKEYGNVEIQWKGPQLENDREGQISVVQNFIGNVDGIVLAPLDSQALVEYVNEAVDENIPVVIFDSGLDDTSNIVSYVATDNYNGGVMAARRMGELLEGKGDVILLRYNPGSESTGQREEGFLDTLKKEFPDINILSSDQYSGTTPQSSLAKATQLLDSYKDEVDGVFAVCEPNAAGTLQALRELELAEKVKFVAFDPNTDLVNGLSEGTVHGIVLQDPVTMGYKAVKAMMEHIEGKEVEKRISTGENVATKENMEEEQMKKLLEPPQFD